MIIFKEPKNSPWGDIDYCDTLCPGVYLVSTSSHGGAMVAKEVEEILSPAARKSGMRKNGFLCFEEDTEESIVLRELLDKKLWEIPDRVQDKAGFEERLNKRLQEYHPQYWRSREKGLAQAQLKLAQPAKSAPAHDER